MSVEGGLIRAHRWKIDSDGFLKSSYDTSGWKEGEVERQ